MRQLTEKGTIMDTKPYITRRPDGEYSTLQVAPGVYETVWFPDEGDSVVVNRTVVSKAQVAIQHVGDYEDRIRKGI